ncbi:uncharacterized protein EDB93DRAFT_1108242 [Suillus bovinus]|uniref:uncharacterized protein n=1 Tax=Suillus bovinus TaxID=48563 RepID=UPI001B8791A9|nr:uncharacterized protein EDB93DRAFT_1108242 [Suillus bovinus]KAG2130942.1 hypothetical protein EDB93DRAFT_1108242 [Suillus bovinus]
MPFIMETLYETKYILEDPSVLNAQLIHFLMFPSIKELEYFAEVIKRRVKRMQATINLTRYIWEKHNLSLKAAICAKYLRRVKNALPNVSSADVKACIDSWKLTVDDIELPQLYSESKISLEILFDHWNSQSWGKYLYLAGVVIGQNQESQCLYLKAKEIAFNILGLIHPLFFSITIVELTSSLHDLEKLHGIIDLDEVVIITGFVEVGPWGSSHTRWETGAREEFMTEEDDLAYRSYLGLYTFVPAGTICSYPYVPAFTRLFFIVHALNALVNTGDAVLVDYPVYA